MPIMTGSQLADEIRHVAPSAGHRVCRTAGGGDTTMVRLAKPFTQVQLAARWRELCIDVELGSMQSLEKGRFGLVRLDLTALIDARRSDRPNCVPAR